MTRETDSQFDGYGKDSIGSSNSLLDSFEVETVSPQRWADVQFTHDDRIVFRATASEVIVSDTTMAVVR